VLACDIYPNARITTHESDFYDTTTTVCSIVE